MDGFKTTQKGNGLFLSRRKGQKIIINGDLEITVMHIHARYEVQLRFTDKNGKYRIMREELLEKDEIKK